MESCAQGAISLKAGKLTLAGPVSGKNADPEPVIRRRRNIGRIAWGVAIAVLLFALAWFNWIEPAREKADLAKREENQIAAAQTEQTESIVHTEKESAKPAQTVSAESGSETDEILAQEASAKSGSETDAETAIHVSDAEAEKTADKAASGKTGTAVGDILPDFRTDLLGGGEFHLEDYRGQVVILNFWAITCAPCIEELPYYEELKESQPEVEILAIHHRVGAKKAEDFLADKGWDHLDFALDSKEKGLYALLEASDALPQTIVLNKEGEVIYNAQTPLTLEQLKALVEQGS